MLDISKNKQILSEFLRIKQSNVVARDHCLKNSHRLTLPSNRKNGHCFHYSKKKPVEDFLQVEEQRLQPQKNDSMS